MSVASELPAARTVVVDVPIEVLRPAPWNPRKTFAPDAQAELAGSLRAHGLLEPIVVRPIEPSPGAPHEYQIICGERRYRAALLAGLRTMAARVLEVDDRTALELSLIENLHRADLDPIEQAEGYKALAEHAGMTQTAIAAAVKVTQPTIARALGLLKLPPDVQEVIRLGSLTVSHGELLLRFAAFPALVSDLAKRAVHKQVTTKQLAENPLLNTWELSQAGLIRRLVDGEFDTAICDACPFGARYGKDKWASYCLRPDHFDELATAAKRERQRETNRAVQAAKRDGTPVLKLDGMPYGSYEQLRNSRPEGCSDACPCAAQALDHGGLLVPICTDPARLRKLQAAAQRAVKGARNAAQQGRRDALAAQLAALDEPSARALAIITAKILMGSHTLSEIRPIAAAYAPGLDLSDRHSLEWSNRAGLREALLRIPVIEQIRLLVAILVEADIRTAAEMEMHAPALADWYLQRGGPATDEALQAAAHELARRHIRAYVRRGDSLDWLAKGGMQTHGDGYSVQIGGYLHGPDPDAEPRKLTARQIGVSRVDGIDCAYVFSLEKTYAEVQAETRTAPPAEAVLQEATDGH